VSTQKKLLNGLWLYLLLYVDDTLIAAKNMDAVNELKESLSQGKDSVESDTTSDSAESYPTCPDPS